MCTAFEKIEETSVPVKVNTLVNMFVLNPSEPGATLPVLVSKHFMGHIEQKMEQYSITNLFEGPPPTTTFL